MRERFGQEGEWLHDKVKYRGNLDPVKYLEECTETWEKEKVPKELWVHLFILLGPYTTSVTPYCY